MSNPAGKSATREEEIAFLLMEQILGIEIKLADAGGGRGRPDGLWTDPSNPAGRGIVEVTSPPATELMNVWAADKRAGRLPSESGVIAARLGQLGQVCQEMLAESWALENIAKLLAHPAHERHLFLFSRTHSVRSYFYRLSDTYETGPPEPVYDIILPEGISDVWFLGRASPKSVSRLGSTGIWLARFQCASGWHRYVATVEEQHLPGPNPSITDDKAPANWRQSKNRTMNTENVQDWLAAGRGDTDG